MCIIYIFKHMYMNAKQYPGATGTMILCRSIACAPCVGCHRFARLNLATPIFLKELFLNRWKSWFGRAFCQTTLLKTKSCKCDKTLLMIKLQMLLTSLLPSFLLTPALSTEIAARASAWMILSDATGKGTIVPLKLRVQLVQRKVTLLSSISSNRKKWTDSRSHWDHSDWWQLWPPAVCWRCHRQSLGICQVLCEDPWEPPREKSSAPLKAVSIDVW